MKHAFVLASFNDAGRHAAFAIGDVILGMADSQFADWSTPEVDLVREATDEEVAAAIVALEAAGDIGAIRALKLASVSEPNRALLQRVFAHHEELATNGSVVAGAGANPADDDVAAGAIAPELALPSIAPAPRSRKRAPRT